MNSSGHRYGADDDGGGLQGRPERSVRQPGVPRARVRDTRGRWAAAAGMVAVAGGVAAGELLAGFASPSLSPLTGVGGVVIDAVPPGVKDWAISLFGTADKAALLTGMALVIAGLAALAGVLEFRRRFTGAVLAGIFGLAGAAAVLTRSQAAPVALLLPLLAAGAAVVLLRLLVGKLAAWQSAASTRDGERTADPTPSRSRRSFLQALAGTAALAAVAGAVAGIWRGAANAVSEARARITLPTPASPAPPIPAAAESGVAGMPPLVTPNRDFYRIDTALTVPAVNPDTWLLKVTGMVAPGGPALLRGPDGQTPDRTPHHHRLRLQQRGRRPDRQRPLAGLAGQGPAGTGRTAAGIRHGALAQHRRLDRRNAPGGADG
ncbi:hypothetical protein J2S98_003652 [Arthrobacter oryzae]|nr:hypothetical protein [Arthrobacter oryzae]